MLASQAGEAGSIPVICFKETKNDVESVFLVFFDTKMILFFFQPTLSRNTPDLFQVISTRTGSLCPTSPILPDSIPDCILFWFLI